MIITEEVQKALTTAAERITLDLDALERVLVGGEFVINNEPEFLVSGEALKMLTQRLKSVEEEREAIVQPLNAVVKNVNSKFKPYKERYEKIISAVKLGVLRYQQREAERKQQEMAAAAQLAAAGQSAGSGQDVQQYQALMASAAAPAPKVQGVSTRETIEWEVVNAALVPVEFTTTYIDPKKVDPIVKEQKLNTKIPGIRVFVKQHVAVRS
jgi:hypothetical protein